MNVTEQPISVSRAGHVHEAIVSWWFDGRDWWVAVDSEAFERVEARENDAFEALCTVRTMLEPHGWRLGVTGARAHVWPSGMARDQGGGLRCYRIVDAVPVELVDTFEPVDPAMVTTVADQRAQADQMYASRAAEAPPTHPRGPDRS